MPRARGQIDVRKSEAILQAALDVLAERGLSAPLEEVARRAKVSKQTVYNHFGSKTQLVQTLVQRSCNQIMAPLEAPGALDQPLETLTAYARGLIRAILTEPYGEIMRLGVSGSLEIPELAIIVYQAAIIGARQKLGGFFDGLNARGVLKIADTTDAAEMFTGLATGGIQMRVLVGADVSADLANTEHRAAAAAAMFLRANAA